MNNKMPDAALQWILNIEGGYKNDPLHDPLDPTYKGITTPTLNYCRRIGLVTATSVSALTDEDVRIIYSLEYWTPCRCSELPGKVGLVLFDCAVNSGPGKAVELLRCAINVVSTTRKVEVSKVMCSPLLDVVAGLPADTVAAAFLTQRLAFYRSLKEYDYDGLGWTNRLNALAKHVGVNWSCVK